MFIQGGFWMRKFLKSGKRLAILFVAVVLAVTAFPLWHAAFAAGSGEQSGDVQADVSVLWQPQQELMETGQTGAVLLTAVLNTSNGKGIKKARVEIRLTQQEASALLQFAGSEGEPDLSKVVDAGGVGISLQQEETGEYFLCFDLDEEHPLISHTLSFAAPSGVTASFDIDISQEDIDILAETGSGSESVPESVPADDSDSDPASDSDSSSSSDLASAADASLPSDASLLSDAGLPSASPSESSEAESSSADGETEESSSGGEPAVEEPVFEKQGGKMTFQASFDWTMNLSALTETADLQALSANDGVLTFMFSAVSGNREETGVLCTAGQTVTFTLTLPEGISLPEGEPAYDDESGAVSLGSTYIGALNGLPEGMVLEKLERGADGRSLTLTAARTAQSTAEEMEDLNGTLSLAAQALAVAPDAVLDGSGAIGLTADMTAQAVAGDVSLTRQASAQTAIAGGEVSNELPGENGETDAQEETKETEGSGTDGQSVDGGTVVHVKDYAAPIQKTIYWADNNNEAFIRPAAAGFGSSVKLAFTLTELDADGNPIEGTTTSSVELSEDTMGQVGLTAMPEVGMTDNGGQYGLRIDGLPSEVVYDDGIDQIHYQVNWEITPSEQNGYELTQVDGEDGENPEGWYYVLLTSFSYSINIWWGTLGSAEGITQAIYDNFEFTGRFGETVISESGLAEVESALGLPEGSVDIELGGADPSNPNMAKVTISNLPKYTLDGGSITYTAQDKVDDDRLDSTDMPGMAEVLGEDYFQISYDNSSSANFGTVADKVHDGGTIYLTLTGTTDYRATKAWLDEATILDENGDPVLSETEAQEVRAMRPTGEFELWRYREGSDYTTATAVRYTEDAPDGSYHKGEIIAIPLDTAADGQELELLNLPKYDAEGYRYIYVLREYLSGETAQGDSANSYEQVFGKVGEDGTLSDTTEEGNRDSGNTYLYYGGTLSNRITDTVTAEASKTWNAAAFQAEFEDVIVKLTLQSRPKGVFDDPQEGWEDTDTVTYMGDFTAEQLSSQVSAVSEAYDYLGRQLEYRWVESGVYQGTLEEGQTPEEAGLANLLEEDGTFVLEQDEEGGEKRRITYSSTREITQITNAQGEVTGIVSKITNAIANEIEYDAEKIWLDESGQETAPPAGTEVTFRLYRLLSGESLTTSEPVLSFTFDENGKIIPEKTEIDTAKYPNLSKVTVKDGEESWKADISFLPEYDESGHEYEYILLEDIGNQDYYPTYVTTRDENRNYHTTVTNAPGEGNRILVRKEWIDDGDMLHREPVEVTVYSRADGTKITSVTLGGQESRAADVWQALVGIGEYETDEVFVLETKTGNTEISWNIEELIKYFAADGSGGGDKADEFFYSGAQDNVYCAEQFTAAYHPYEASFWAPAEVAGETLYVVENRRLGNIDLTVTKNWIDGDDSMRGEIQAALDKIQEQAETPGSDVKSLSLALRLVFADYTGEDSGKPEYYEITRTWPADQQAGRGDTITVALEPVAIRDNTGSPVCSIQEVDLAEASSNYYFYNLPKYDRTGQVVHYTVEEVWLDSDGNEVTLADMQANPAYSELYELLANYGVGYEDTLYETHNEMDRLNDEQEITVTNRLTGTKSVLWHKQWNDDYTYTNGQRPDIYLDIYQVKHTKDESGQVEEQVSLYRENYRWVASDAAGDGDVNPDGLYDIEVHWHAVLEGLPKYDELGYEIFYYAVEKTTVNSSQFDYTDVRYSVQIGENLTDIGTEYEINDVDADNDGTADYAQYVVDVSEDAVSRYALMEGGTFTNTIATPITIEGQKLWSALKAGYPSVDLPDVTFTLYRKLNGETLRQQTQDDGTVKYVGDISGAVYETADGDPVAEITVSNWANIYQNGTYVFYLSYEGKNVMTVSGGGEVSYVPENPDAGLLQKYDGKGRLYSYSLEETGMSWNGAAIDNWEELYTINSATNTYVTTNVYNSPKGSLGIKKLLRLPLDGQGSPEAFPAVTFQLYRAYESLEGAENGNPQLSDYELVDEVVWSSAEVKAAYEAAKKQAEDAGSNFDPSAPLEWTYAFTGLEIYAPNGREYVYKVAEVTEELGGYDTWAGSGDLEWNEITAENGKFAGQTEVNNLAPSEAADASAPQSGETAATFANSYAETRETVTLTGSKIWQDYNNAMGLRPPDIILTLYRYAPSQEGQNNGIGSATDPQKVDEGLYSVSWSPADGTESTAASWTYTITGTGTNADELERYAPNGMEWKYIAEEKLPDGSVYNSSPSSGRVTERSRQTETGEDGVTATTITMNPLTNSLQTAVSFSKTWVDSDGEEITEDYLGIELGVTFTLQVAEAAYGADGTTISNVSDWSDASEYFEENLSPEAYNAIFGNYSFTKKLTGNLGSAVWGQANTFSALPRMIVKKDAQDGTVTYLLYRAVETEISYGGTPITVTAVDSDDNRTYTYRFGEGTEYAGFLEPAYWANGRAGEGENQNDKQTTYNNYYTAQTYNRLKTTDFAVTKAWVGDGDNVYGTRPDSSAARYDWETSFVIQRSEDGGKTWTCLTDGEGEPVTVTVYGQNSSSSASQTIGDLPANGLDAGGKVVSYQYRARELQPDWTKQKIADGSAMVEEGGSYNDSYRASYDDKRTLTYVTNTMDAKEITAVKSWLGNDSLPVTLTLQYKKADQKGSYTWTDVAQVSLNGEADTEGNRPSKYYYESEAWTALWKNLPVVMPDSYLESGETQTTYRVIESSGNFIQVNKEETEKGSSAATEFTLQNVRTVSLTVSKTWYGVGEAEREPVVLQLYRTTDADYDFAEPGSAPDEPEDAQAVGGTVTLGGNTGEDENSGKDVWTHTFTNLPKYDEKGSRYIYFVREVSAGGVPVGDGSFDYQVWYSEKAAEDGNSFEAEVINIGETSISGTKTWQDESNGYGTRPDELTLTLYRRIAGGREEKVEAEPVFENTDGDVWTYSYVNLPLTDPEGSAYIYRVEETVPEEYALTQKDYDLTNTLTDTIELTVYKIWQDSGDKEGERPDSITLVLYADGTECRRATLSRGFLGRIWDAVTGNSDKWSYTFTNLPEYNEDGSRIVYTVREEDVPEDYQVFVDDENLTVTNVKNGNLQVTKTVTGSAGDTSREFHFTVTLEDTSINGVYGEMEFVNGVAQFTLKHGESVTAEGLPGGVGYRVTEEDDGAGYTTTASAAEGTIPCGDTATAAFVNHKDSPPAPGDSPENDKGTPETGGAASTGDGAKPWIYAGLAAAAAAILAGGIWIRARKKRAGKQPREMKR